MKMICNFRSAAIAVTSLLAGFSSSPVQALDFTEFGAVTLASPSIQQYSNASAQTSSGIGGGVGITLGYRLFDKADLESGMLFFTQSFSLSSVASPSSYTFWQQNIPVMFRYWIIPELSAAFGIYYGRELGNVTVGQGYQSYSQLRWAADTGGICFSARYRKPFNELMSFVAEVRSIVGLFNEDKSDTGSMQTRTVLFLAGISFLL